MVSPLISQGLGLLVFLIASRAAMRKLTGVGRELAMAGLSLAGVYFFFFRTGHAIDQAKFGCYAVIVLLQFALMRKFAESDGWRFWLAFLAPISVLVFFRYLPAPACAWLGHFVGRNDLSQLPALAGLSYLAFRCSRLVLEVQAGAVKKPGICQYLTFAFFVPTMAVGPINSYANFRRGFEESRWDVPLGRALLRILVGFVKFKFLGGVFSQLDYESWLLNGHPHHWVELPVAMVFYYFYLYCNFSGFCDMAIGAAAIVGIPVPENFENPMAARNMKEFWNRWHITLSQWMRDIVFAPLSKSLVHVMGVKWTNHAVALAIGVTFLLIGIWHGTGLHYAAFGLTQAIGVATVHYYTIFLKKRLGREGFKAYNQNRWIHAAAVVVTFCLMSATLFLFANTLGQVKQILLTMK